MKLCQKPTTSIQILLVVSNGVCLVPVCSIDTKKLLRQSRPKAGQKVTQEQKVTQKCEKSHPKNDKSSIAAEPLLQMTYTIEQNLSKIKFWNKKVVSKCPF